MLTIDASRTTTKSAIASNTSAHQRRSTRRDDAAMLVVIDILRPLIEMGLVGQEAARLRSPHAHNRPSAVGIAGWFGARRARSRTHLAAHPSRQRRLAHYVGRLEALADDRGRGAGAGASQRTAFWP